MRYSFSFFTRPTHLVDAWSVPHFLLGSLVAMLATVFVFPFLSSLFSTLVIAILWEFIEMRVGIREARWNVFGDIVLPLLAFVVTAWLVSGVNMDHDHHVALLVVTIVLYTLVSYAAWYARFHQDPDFLG